MAEEIALKKGKKKWYQIQAPDFISKNSLGETTSIDPKNLINKHLSKGLSEVTNDPKMQNAKITFTINNVIDNKCLTIVSGYELVSSYLRRAVKVGKDRIDDSFIAETKDKVKIRVKPFIVTKFKCNNSIKRSIRDTAREILIKEASSYDFNQFLTEIIFHKIQSQIKEKVTKIYPVTLAEVRMITRL